MQYLVSRLKLHAWDGLSVLAALLLILTLLFGGASRLHTLRLALTELAALPLLVVAVAQLARQERLWDHRFALLIVAGIAAVPIIQLTPLPPAIWASLPGRQELVVALELAGIEPGWSSISLTPHRTQRAGLALLPPVAIFLATLAAGPRVAPRLMMVYLALAVVSMFLGAAQLASGGERLYPWETTDAGSVNGFFANSNHFASFLLALLPFALVSGAAALRSRRSGHMPLWLAALFSGLVVVTLAAIRSRAGILLLVPITSLALIAAWVAAGPKRAPRPLLLVACVIGAALSAVVAFGMPRILSRFEEPVGEGRFDRWPTVAEAAQAYLPVGSGLGSFDPVYRSVEPLSSLDATFFNQAHNEYLEIWLETGWLGPFLFVAFLVWFSRRAVSAWRAAPHTLGDLQRASTVAVVLTMAHSFADYPLRTVAFSTLFALTCGVLELTQSNSDGLNSEKRSPRRSPEKRRTRAP